LLIRDLLAIAIARLFPRLARRRRQRNWERLWGREDFDPPWSGRGISPEIEAAVQQGWLKPGPVLDIGCGLGEVAAWFAERGYEAVGVDIAFPVIERARKMHSHLEQPPHFCVRDITAGPAPDRQYRILIDRGCFHQLPSGTELDFLRHLLAVSAPDARMLLFIRAFRNGIPFGDPAEQARQEAKVRAAFCPQFSIERVNAVFIDRHQGDIPERALPGLVFHLTRQQTALNSADLSRFPI